MKAKLLILLITVILAGCLYGMDLSVGPCMDYQRKCLILKGDIRKGDAEKFKRFIFDDADSEEKWSNIILISSGGEVEAALALAEEIRKSYEMVFVEESLGACGSACFYLWAAAVERDVWNDAKIGLHRPYLTKERAKTILPEDLDKHNKVLAKKVSEKLREWEIPEYLIEKMLAMSSVDVYWLTKSDLQAIPTVSSAWEESVIAKCDIEDPRIKCNVFSNCKNAEDIIEGFLRNDATKEYVICYAKFRALQSDRYFIDLAIERDKKNPQ